MVSIFCLQFKQINGCFLYTSISFYLASGSDTKDFQKKKKNHDNYTKVAKKLDARPRGFVLTIDIMTLIIHFRKKANLKTQAYENLEGYIS